jgi:hypothetical protein
MKYAPDPQHPARPPSRALVFSNSFHGPPGSQHVLSPSPFVTPPRSSIVTPPSAFYMTLSAVRAQREATAATRQLDAVLSSSGRRPLIIRSLGREEAAAPQQHLLPSPLSPQLTTTRSNWGCFRFSTIFGRFFRFFSRAVVARVIITSCPVNA